MSTTRSEPGPFDFAAIAPKTSIFPNPKPPETPSRKRAISVPPISPSAGGSPSKFIDFNSLPRSPSKSPVRKQLRFTSVPRTLGRDQSREQDHDLGERERDRMDVDQKPNGGASSSQRGRPPTISRPKQPSFTPHRLAALMSSPLTPLPPTPMPPAIQIVHELHSVCHSVSEQTPGLCTALTHTRTEWSRHIFRCRCHSSSYC